MYIQVCKGVSTTIDPFWDISLDLPAGTPVIPGAPAPGISLQVSQSWIFITRTKLFLNILKKTTVQARTSETWKECRLYNFSIGFIPLLLTESH